MGQSSEKYQASRSRLCLLLPLLCLLVARVWAAELPATVTTALKEAGIPIRSVSVVVQDIDSKVPLIRHNAEQPMNPASVMKLVTTYAALELLDPAYVWTTEALGDRPPVEGRLDGNLYLRGSGDPRLALEQFWLLLRRLRVHGVRDINGDLVLDRSAFLLPPHDPGEFDREPLRPYNAGPDALLVNLKSIHLTLQPDPGGTQVEILAETPSDGLHLVNRLKLSDEPCGDWREKFKVDAGADAIELRGVFPAACGPKALHLSPWPADMQVGRLFSALWRELGGTFAGRVREGKAPVGASVLAVNESPALGEVVREINKYSNNVMARQVFLTLAADRPATPEAARRRIEDWLTAKGLRMPGLILDNGSGLSRRERISAESLGRLLLAAWRSPVMPELFASLPIAGIDGTMKKRLGDSTATGRARLKTGYLENVRSIAGYVQDADDRRWIVVFLINDAKARGGKPAMDALLRWLAER